MIEVFRHEGAGRSAERRYKRLSRAWRRRVFGRRFSLYFWAIYGLLLILVVNLRLSGGWSLYLGFVFGAAAATWLLMPDALMPGHIFNWQVGAWGEQNTGSELKRLEREGWAVAHDRRWGQRGNHDHVVAGDGVYVLNTKNLKDSSVTIEDGKVRVTHLDTDDGYLADRWVPSAENEARSIKRELCDALGFPVHVYPVVVLWGSFQPGQQYIGDVSVVRGDKLVEWIKSRPADLSTQEKRQAVGRAVEALPRA